MSRDPSECRGANDGLPGLWNARIETIVVL